MKIRTPFSSPIFFFAFFCSLLFAACPFTLAATIDSASLAAKADTASHSSGKLIFAIDFIRHGDRTPLIDLPTVDYTWKKGLGQLTSTGIEQEFELGEKFKNRYITQTHLLPEHYTPGTLSVQSTGLDRTIMSANSALTGLYLGTGPTCIMGIPIIPIHSCPIPQEDCLIPDNNVNFNFSELTQQVVIPSQQWQDKEASVKNNFSHWSEATGVPITCLYDLKNLGDTLFVYQLKNIPTPSLLSKEDINTIITTGLWASCTTFQNKIVAQSAAANILQKITTALQTASQQPDQALHYQLYSAHESTLMVILAALGSTTPVTTIPHYASNINLELFDEGNGTYTVQIMFNDEPVILSCSGTNSCTLDQLKVLADDASAQLKQVQVSQKANL